MTNRVELNTLISNTISNAEGYLVFVVIDKLIRQDLVVHLSLKDLSPFSTSFLNSSFGALVDAHGLDKVKKYIKLTDYRMSQANSIKQYLENLSAYHFH